MPATIVEHRPRAREQTATPTIAKTMKAAVVEKFRQPLQIREVRKVNGRVVLNIADS